MKYRLIILFGCLITFLGAGWVFLWHFLPIGITDAEVGHVMRTGLPSHPEALVWSEWTTNQIQEVAPLHRSAELRGANATLVRRGVAKTWAGSFTIYQTKYQMPDGTTADVCGWGPDWGTRMNMAIPWAVLLSGGIIAAIGIFASRQTAQQTPAGDALKAAPEE